MNRSMKDTALLDEGDGGLQVLSHTEAQHDAGEPPPAGAMKGERGTHIVETTNPESNK